MPNHHILIAFKRSRLATTLISLTTILLFLHGLGLYFTYALGYPFVKGFVPLFNFDEESNVPTFYSSMLLLMASALFYWITRIDEATGSKQVWRWRLLSLLFFYLAVDEFATIHELLIGPLRDMFHLTGIFYFSWVIAGMAGVSLLGIFYFRFVINLPSRFRSELLLAAALYLTGVIGFEMIGGNYAYIHGAYNIQYALITTGEELFEIAGLITLINALIKYLQTHQATLEITTHE